MPETTRILVAATVPPLTLPTAGALRCRSDNPLPRLGRLAWLLAAISLPVLGLSFADLVHREGEMRTLQAAASPTPSGAVAAPSDAIPAVWPAGMASRTGAGRDLRG